MSRILIVEDSPTNMMLAVAVLESEGHTLLQAGRAGEAIEIARREHPDIILMDIGLPDMDGMEATRILKAEPGTKDIPIIALTAYAMKGDKERILDAGCDGYIEKPIRYKVFLAAVDAAVRQRGDGDTG